MQVSSRAGIAAISTASFCALAISGCGGGGAKNPPVAFPTASSQYSQHPVYAGAVYLIAGADRGTITYADGTSQSGSDVVSNTQTLVYPATFKGESNLMDYQEHVTASQGATNEDEIFNNYEKWELSATNPTGANLVLLAHSDVLKNPSETTTDQGIYPNYEIIDELPHSTGNSWKLDPESTYNFTDQFTSPVPLTNQIAQDTASDGSYSETYQSTYPAGSYVESFIQNPDGSGLQQVVYGTDQYPSTMRTLGAPKTIASGMKIPIVDSQGDGKTPPIASPEQDVPDWYPGGSPLPFYSGSRTDRGSAALPPQCNTGPGIPTTGEDIETDIQTIDLWGDERAGSTITNLTSSDYVAPYSGVVCSVTTILLTAWYDGRYVLTSNASTVLALQAVTIPEGAQPITASASLRTSSKFARPDNVFFPLSRMASTHQSLFLRRLFLRHSSFKGAHDARLALFETRR